MPKTKYKKQKDGRYRRRVKIGYYDNGNVKYKSIYGRTEKELEANYNAFINKKNAGLLISDEKITLREWSAEWLKTYKRDVAFNTFKMYKNCVENHIGISSIADVPVCKIKPIQIQVFVNEEKEKGIAITHKVCITLKQIFEQAVENNLILKNPFKKIDFPKQPKKEKRVLTDEEEKAIKKADFSLTEQTFIDLCRYAGLRRGEALALSIFDVDLKRKKIRVNKTIIHDKKKSFIQSNPKTDAGNRIVPIPQPLQQTLKKLFVSLQSELLFENKGKLYTKSDYNKLWKNIKNKINFYLGDKKTNLSAHILRHTYATYLYYAGVDVKTASKWMGHTSVSTTLEVYTHLKSDLKSEENKLNTFLNAL